MRKIIAFDWSFDLEHLNGGLPELVKLSISKPNGVFPIGFVVNDGVYSEEDPFRLQYGKIDDPNFRTNLYLCDRPVFVFDDNTVLGFNRFKLGMNRRDFCLYVKDKVDTHMRNEPELDACDIMEPIF